MAFGVKPGRVRGRAPASSTSTSIGARARAVNARVHGRHERSMTTRGDFTRVVARRSSTFDDAPTKAVDDASETLTRATTCARLSNFIYKGSAVEQWIAEDGFDVIASGATGATAWRVCDRRGERFVVIRGAAWSQPDTDRNKLSWQIAKVWPIKLRRGVNVVCHQGVYEMVDEFWRDIAPYLTDETFGGKFSFTGHSLGGSMALVIAARARLELGIEEDRMMPIHTFGSPPVLAYDGLASGAGGGMDDILRLCGFSKGAAMVRQFVLAKDIIPRMWLSADPVFSAATKMDLIASALDWRKRTFGDGIFTRERFLYQTCGDLYWLEYPSGGANASAKQPLLTRHYGDEVLEKLQMELGEVTESPLAALQTALDHNSQNYVDALQFLTVKRIMNTIA